MKKETSREREKAPGRAAVWVNLQMDGAPWRGGVSLAVLKKETTRNRNGIQAEGRARSREVGGQNLIEIANTPAYNLPSVRSTNYRDSVSR